MKYSGNVLRIYAGYVFIDTWDKWGNIGFTQWRNHVEVFLPKDNCKTFKCKNISKFIIFVSMFTVTKFCFNFALKDKFCYLLRLHTMQPKVVWRLTVYTLLKEDKHLFDPKGVKTWESRGCWTWERNFGVKMFHCSTNRKTL